jgi:hypothetical protein
MVPVSIYDLQVRVDKTKAWMAKENRWWRLEFVKVEKRTAIQFHYGKDYKWSEGCIILTGNSKGDVLCKEGTNSPEEAVATLRRYVIEGSDSNTKIRVRIAYA